MDKVDPQLNWLFKGSNPSIFDSADHAIEFRKFLFVLISLGFGAPELGRVC